MKNVFFVCFVCSFMGCTKPQTTSEEILTPTLTEKKMIDAASAFFKSGGEYQQIEGAYSVALRPMLTVRRTLTEGACTANVFQTQCCCPWEFSMAPYDIVNGSASSYNYPKSVVFTSKPGEMEGSFSAMFETRPVSTDKTTVHYTNLKFIEANRNLNGDVSIRDVIVSPTSNNVMCTAEFSNNSFDIGAGKITSISGHLISSDGDDSGKLDITFADGRKIIVEAITVALHAMTSFLQKASFTTYGLTSEIDFDKQTITIADRTFKLNLN